MDQPSVKRFSTEYSEEEFIELNDMSNSQAQYSKVRLLYVKALGYRYYLKWTEAKENLRA